MARRVFDRIKERVRLGQYDMTRHAVEEMAEDDLDIYDVEQGILSGTLTREEKDDPRGTRYIIVGTGTDEKTEVGVVGRFTETGRFLIITVYEIKNF